MSRISLLSRSIQIGFARHEAWALRNAMRFPLLSIYLFGTMWVWMVIPAPIAFLVYAMMFSSGVLAVVGILAGMVLGIGFHVAVSPWFFRWYFICVGLMFGKRKMARKRELEIREWLSKLLGSQAKPSTQ